MKKQTEGTKAADARHPAEIEAERLRLELADERTKTEALSRRCIRLVEALDATLKAEADRTDNDMFKIINGNCERHKAAVATARRRRAHEKKLIAAFDRACRRNAVCLATSFLLGLTVAILGFTCLIPAVAATVIGAICTMAFGWALNDCVYLLGRCK